MKVENKKKEEPPQPPNKEQLCPRCGEALYVENHFTYTTVSCRGCLSIRVF